jgi:hypothetical protein
MRLLSVLFMLSVWLLVLPATGPPPRGAVTEAPVVPRFAARGRNVLMGARCRAGPSALPHSITKHGHEATPHKRKKGRRIRE